MTQIETPIVEKKSPFGGWKLFGTGGMALILFGATFFLISSIAVYASRMGATPGDPGSMCSVNGSIGGTGRIPDGANTDWKTNIHTNTFASCNHTTGQCADNTGKYQDRCDGGSSGFKTDCSAPTQMFAAVPYPLAQLCKAGGSPNLANCARIEVLNPKNNRSVVLAILDTGPFNTNDKDYVLGTSPPRSSNAGLDISEDAMRVLIGSADSGHNFNWRFTTAPITGGGGNTDPCISIPSLNGKTIVLDPGHGLEGGHWHNTVGYASLGPVNGAKSEDEDNWNLALKVRDVLASHGYGVTLTKSSAEDNPSFSARVNVANSKHATLYVSLHSNDTEGGAGGAMGIVRCQNANGKGDIHLADDSVCESTPVIDQNKAISRVITNRVQQAFQFNAAPKFMGAHLGTLSGLTMPGVLIETYCHDVLSDRQKVEGHLDQMAQAVAQGIMDVTGGR